MPETSCWKNYNSLNEFSIGIEISNWTYLHLRNLPQKQINSLIKLLT